MPNPALDELADFTIEVPSWAYGNSGTRFKVFSSRCAPRPVREDRRRRAGAPFTGVAPRVSLHIPWDRVDDYDALTTHAKEHGVRIGAINSNVFQDDDYKLGSLTHPDARIRAKAVAHLLECIDIMRATGSPDLKLWFPDGTNYAGPGLAARPAGPARRVARRRSTTRSTPTSGCCWSTSCSSRTFYTHGRPRLGHVAAALPGARRARRRSCSTPATTPRHQHRVHRHAAAAGGQARRVRLQLPVLRRRRPDGRRRPTRSSCSGSCTRSSPSARTGRSRASTSCSTSATTSSRRSPARSAR